MLLGKLTPVCILNMLSMSEQAGFKQQERNMLKTIAFIICFIYVKLVYKIPEILDILLKKKTFNLYKKHIIMDFYFLFSKDNVSVYACGLFWDSQTCFQNIVTWLKMDVWNMEKWIEIVIDSTQLCNTVIQKYILKSP